MKLDEYYQFDATGLAQLVRNREVSPLELGQCAIAAIESSNPGLNAVIEVYDQPKSIVQAAIPDGPFYGVPFLIKDLVLHEEGRACEMGSRLCQGMIAPSDTDLMRRFRQAGLMTLGRTTTPELGFNVSAETLLQGNTGNPWQPDLMAGGSSGGSAAAVASGMVPFAHANDGGGSIRVPASCCGLLGLKPSRGRIPIGPEAAEGLNGLGCEFALTRSVRDAAALMDAVQGPGIGDPYQIPQPPIPYTQVLEGRPGNLKIAWTEQPWSGVPVDSEVTQGLARTVQLCEELGHQMEAVRPEIDCPAFIQANTVVWSANLAHWVDMVCAMTGRRACEDTLEATTLAIYDYGRQLTANELLGALDQFNRVNRTVGAFFEEYDILLTPTNAKLPQPHGIYAAYRDVFDAQGWAEHIFGFAPFTAIFNVTGQPAVSVPLQRTESRVPIGMQFAAGFGREDLLFSLAVQLEQAAPWPQTIHH